MKNRGAEIIRYFITGLVLCTGSCDQFKSDVTPPVILKNDYYILPGTPVIIDLKSIVKQSFQNFTLAMAQSPAKGNIKWIDPLTLEYNPRKDFVSGIDQFEFSINAGSQTVQKETISIYVKQKLEDFPCSLYAMADSSVTKPGVATIIKFLANDKLCGVDLSTLKTSIYKQPGKGTVILAGDSIEYEPVAAFIGVDSIYYKISSNNSSSIGVVKIEVSSSQTCHSILKDTYILDLSGGINNPLSTGLCQGYKIIDIFDIIDKPCSIGATFSFGYERVTSYSGGFCADLDWVFTYVPNDQMIPPKNDTAVYRICVNEVCKDVTFIVKRTCSLSLSSIRDHYTLDLTDDTPDPQVSGGDCAGGYDLFWNTFWADNPTCNFTIDQNSFGFGGLVSSSTPGAVCWDESGIIAYMPGTSIKNDTIKINLGVDGKYKTVLFYVKRQ